MKKIIIYLGVVVLVVCFSKAAYAQSLFGLTTREEVVIGEKIAKDIEKSLPLYDNPVYYKRLVRIGYKIARTADRKDLDYKFFVLDKKGLNAFATFGGYVYVYKGTMDKADDDELASVLAHEIAHVSARHLAKSVEKTRAFNLWFNLLDMFLLKDNEQRRNIHQLIGTGYGLIQRGYSRQDEFEADKLGTRFAYKAGYSLFAAIRLLNKLKKEEAEKGHDPFAEIGILRTHPYIDERIDANLSEIASIKAEESLNR